MGRYAQRQRRGGGPSPLPPAPPAPITVLDVLSSGPNSFAWFFSGPATINGDPLAIWTVDGEAPTSGSNADPSTIVMVYPTVDGAGLPWFSNGATGVFFPTAPWGGDQSGVTG